MYLLDAHCIIHQPLERISEAQLKDTPGWSDLVKSNAILQEEDKFTVAIS